MAPPRVALRPYRQVSLGVLQEEEEVQVVALRRQLDVLVDNEQYEAAAVLQHEVKRLVQSIAEEEARKQEWQAERAARKKQAADERRRGP